MSEENGEAAFVENAGGDLCGDARPFVRFVSTVTPAEITYGPLLEAIGAGVRAELKELEVLARDVPPPDYDFGAEVKGIGRAVGGVGQEGVHLVGFSAGANAAPTFAARYPERAQSLALIEPPFVGDGNKTPEEDAFWADAAMALPPPERMERSCACSSVTA